MSLSVVIVTLSTIHRTQAHAHTFYGRDMDAGPKFAVRSDPTYTD